MKAAVLYAPGDIRIKEVSVPEIFDNEVLLVPKLVGLCGTDLSFFRGHRIAVKPLILGHEFTGTIFKVGKSVTHFKVGDRVVGEHVIGCDTCELCKDHRENLCEKKKVIGITTDGALAEYVKVPEKLLHKLPEKCTFDEAVLVEPLAVALYSVDKIKLIKNMIVAVIGQGMIGLMIDAVLKSRGVVVVGVDIVNERLEFARKHGFVQNTLNSKENTASEMVKKYPTIDAVFEVVGHETTAQLALDLAKVGGSVVLLGLFPPKNTINLLDIIKKELTLVGSINCAGTFDAAIHMIHEKKINTAGLITYRYPLEQTKIAFDQTIAHPQASIKTVIEVN
jgi:threonine dehydrogenase-like Zn-dependent dehydrogenase